MVFLGRCGRVTPELHVQEGLPAPKAKQTRLGIQPLWHPSRDVLTLITRLLLLWFHFHDRVVVCVVAEVWVVRGWVLNMKIACCAKGAELSKNLDAEEAGQKGHPFLPRPFREESLPFL